MELGRELDLRILKQLVGQLGYMFMKFLYLKGALPNSREESSSTTSSPLAIPPICIVL